MNKKIRITSLILLLFSIALFIILGGFLDSRNYYNECIVDTNTYNSIKNRLSSKDIDDIVVKFDGYDLFYDSSDNHFYYSLIENRELSYNPQIEINDDYKIAINNEKITDEAISSNRKINFIIYNDSNYKEYTLSCTTLPLMNIDYDGEEFFYEDQPMVMTVFDNREEAINRILKSFGNLRLRGTFTAGFPKQGMRITLLNDDWWTKNNLDLLGLRNDDDWILYAGYNDVDKVRNVFTANLWGRACANNNSSYANTGTEYKYLELFINKKYYGLYALAFPIDAKQLNLKSSDGLYQPYMGQHENEITFDNYEKVRNEMRLKYGNNWDILINYYERLFKAYRDEDINTIKNIIDIDNAIDFFIFNNIIQGDDNASPDRIKNTKICIKKIDGYYRCLYIPWDFDMSFGNEVDYESKNNTNNYYNEYTRNIIHESNPINLLFKFDDEETRKKLHLRYIQLRSEQMSNENISNLIDELENKIYGSGAYFRDMERWPEGSYVEEEYNLNRFKNYVLKRFEYLDQYYEFN